MRSRLCFSTLLFLLGFSFSSVNVLGSEKKCPQPKVIADQFLQLGFRGYFSTIPKPNCFKDLKTDFKYKLTNRDEARTDKHHAVDSMNQIQIRSVKSLGPHIVGERFEVKFDLVGKDLKKLDSDELTFISYSPGSVGFESYGCAELEVAPRLYFSTLECKGEPN
jgi:hypothetical protein